MIIVRVEDQHDVYGGRGPKGKHMLNTKYPKKGWLGNPHCLNLGRDVCIEKFRNDFEQKILVDDYFKKAILSLAGKRVACFCRPLRCHLDIVAEWLKKNNG